MSKFKLARKYPTISANGRVELLAGTWNRPEQTGAPHCLLNWPCRITLADLTVQQWIGWVQIGKLSVSTWMVALRTCHLNFVSLSLLHRFKMRQTILFRFLQSHSWSYTPELNPNSWIDPVRQGRDFLLFHTFSPTKIRHFSKHLALASVEMFSFTGSTVTPWSSMKRCHRTTRLPYSGKLTHTWICSSTGIRKELNHLITGCGWVLHVDSGKLDKNWSRTVGELTWEAEICWNDEIILTNCYNICFFKNSAWT